MIGGSYFPEWLQRCAITCRLKRMAAHSICSATGGWICLAADQKGHAGTLEQTVLQRVRHILVCGIYKRGWFSVSLYLEFESGSKREESRPAPRG